MSTWKRILTEDDVTSTNLSNTNLTQSQSTRNYVIDGPGSNLNFVSEHGGTILQIASGPQQAADAITIKGTVSLLGSTDASTSNIKFFEAADNGTNNVQLQASDFTESYIIRLPTADGTNGQVLQTDGSGNLSFADAGGGTIDGTGAANKIAIWSDSDTLTNDTDLAWSSSNNTLSSVNFNASSNVTCAILTADAIVIAKQPSTNAAGAYDGAGTRIFSKVGSNNVIANAAGKVCYLGGSGTGTWNLADKDAESTSVGLLAVYPNAGGPSVMVREGVVKMASNQGYSSAAAGTALYLGDDGAVQTAVPGTGDIARIVGYVLNASSNIIYFCPDNSYVKVS